MDRQKLKRQQFLIKTHHKIDGKLSRQRCMDPGSGFGLEKIMDLDPVCPERLDPDSDNIRPDPKPQQRFNSLEMISVKDEEKNEFLIIIYIYFY